MVFVTLHLVCRWNVVSLCWCFGFKSHRHIDIANDFQAFEHHLRLHKMTMHLSVYDCLPLLVFPIYNESFPRNA